jgi:hypothetical protein
MYCKALLILISAVPLVGCATNRAADFLAQPLDMTRRQAAAIEHNRLLAAKAASGEAQDPWRHLRPYDRQ